QPMPPPLPEDPRGKLEELLRLAQASAPGLQADYRVEEGDAAARIVGAAQETRCDLIVMGTHGRTGLGRALMGSVAEQVLRTAPCPVVTVKAPAKAGARRAPRATGRCRADADCHERASRRPPAGPVRVARLSSCPARPVRL